MPTLELTDEEAQQLTLVLANASGPGISWMMTNGLLTKVQQAAAKGPGLAGGKPSRQRAQQQDGLDLDRNTALPQEH
jgi:hypothetical protein